MERVCSQTGLAPRPLVSLGRFAGTCEADLRQRGDRLPKYITASGVLSLHEKCPWPHLFPSVVYSSGQTRGCGGAVSLEGEGHLIGPGQKGWIGGCSSPCFSDPHEPASGAFLGLPGLAPSRRWL